MPPIRGIFFDCDNTLVQTETAAFEPTADLVNATLAKGGVQGVHYISARVTAEFCGKQFKEMIPELEKMHNFKLSDQDKEDIFKLENEEVTKAVGRLATATLGVHLMLKKLLMDKTYKVGVVSSSSLSRIKAALKAANLNGVFSDDQIFSAKDSNPQSKEPKPDPQIYDYAMEKFGLKPYECVAFEDSIGGCLAVLEAGIYLVPYLGCYNTPFKQLQLSRDMLELLEVECVINDWKQFWFALNKVEKKAPDG